MNKYIYQAKFKMSNAVSDKGFKTAQQSLNVFSDLSEQVSENIFNCDILVDIKARLSSDKTGLITLVAPRQLTHEELQQVANLTDFETNEDGFNDSFDFVDTKDGHGTEVVWHANTNQFRLVNAFSNGKAIAVA